MKYGFSAVLAAALLASVPALAQSQGSGGQGSAGQTGLPQTQTSGQPQASSQAGSGGQQQAQNTQSSGDQSQTQAISPRFTRMIQMRLHRAGMLDEAPNGVWDSDTAEAVGNFQQQHNLEPTGQLDGLTILALMSRPAPAAGTGSDGNTAQSGSSGPDQQPQAQSSQAPAGQAATGGLNMNVAADAYVAGFTRGVQQGFREAQAMFLTARQNQMQRRMQQQNPDDE